MERGREVVQLIPAPPRTGRNMRRKRRREGDGGQTRRPHIHIPEDIISDILTRLRVKPLLRFRSVCKPWLSLISSTRFVRQHLDRARKEPRILLQPFSLWQKRPVIQLYLLEKAGSRWFLELSTRKPVRGRGTEILYPICCDGLVVTSTRRDIHVCNPSTKEFFTLPPGQREQLLLPRQMAQMVGLGYDPQSGRYKVVRCFYNWYDSAARSCSMGCEVFTVGETGSWRAAREDPPYPIFEEDGELANGAVHWKIDNRFHSSSPEAILSFDLRDERFRVVPAPPCFSEPNKKIQDLALLGLQGYLCCVDFLQENRDIDIWVLKDYGTNLWTREYSVRLIQRETCLKPIMTQHGKILINAGDRLVYFDPKSGDCESLVDFENNLRYYDPRRRAFRRFKNGIVSFAEIYVESLVSVIPK